MFNQIFDAIEEWMRELLTGMISSNLDRMFTDVNQKTSEIAGQVGQTPQGWNGSIFSMIEGLSNSVIMPIAGIIITFVLCMFLVTALFLNTAKSKQELENAIFQTAGIAQKYNCMLKRLDYQQEEGLMSSLPLGVSHIPIKRALTTTSTAIFIPFTTQELFMGGDSLYYGLNAR